MARARIDLDDPARALGLLETGLRIGREISNRTLQRDANYVGALAWFCMGELDSARRAIDDACRASTTEFHHSTFALQGLVALKQDDRKTALKAFGTARSHAANAHARNRRDYLAWDTSGLAAAGSVFLLVDDVLHREAIAAYRKARRISSEDGVVAHAMRLLQGVPDPDGLLADVCLAASGRSSQHLGQGHGPT
jgi:tetratricopeptide (TPR) repeat protein